MQNALTLWRFGPGALKYLSTNRDGLAASNGGVGFDDGAGLGAGLALGGDEGAGGGGSSLADARGSVECGRGVNLHPRALTALDAMGSWRSKWGGQWHFMGESGWRGPGYDMWSSGLGSFRSLRTLRRSLGKGEWTSISTSGLPGSGKATRWAWRARREPRARTDDGA